MAQAPHHFSSQDGFGLSQSALMRLLAQKEKENDAQLASEFQGRLSQMQAHDALASAIFGLTDAAELARLAAEALQRELGGSQWVLSLIDENQFLQVLGHTGHGPAPYQVDLLEEAFIVGELLTMSGSDAQALSSRGNAECPVGVSLVALPLFRRDGLPLGALLVEGPMRLGRARWLAGMAARVAQALEDCLHHNRIEKLILDAAIAISTTHERGSGHPEGHFSRLSECSGQIAKAMGLGPAEEKHVRLLARLHGLSPETLMREFGRIRRGTLTAEQWKILLARAFEGESQASPLSGFQRVVSEARFFSRRREAPLPIAPRITAVSAAFEDMTRRQGLSPQRAIALLHSQGRHDPTVLAALTRLHAQARAS